MLGNIPVIIGNAQTLCVAETKSPYNQVERYGKTVDIVYIAICQYNKEEGFYLFGCDKEFNTHTDSYYDTLEEALQDAKRLYNIEKSNWQKPLKD